MGRKRRNNVYRHYMLQEETQTATCLLCFKTLHSIHGSNLMHHLKFMHKVEYNQILALNSGAIPPPASPPRVSQNSNDDDSVQSDAGVEVDVEKFFTLEIGTTRARCDVCQSTVERKYMASHLKRDHPKILKPNDDSDGDEINDNLYQEVVYLYDSDSKSTKVSKPMKQATSTPISNQQPRVKRKMRRMDTQSSRHFESSKRSRTREFTSPPVDESTEELDNFGKYVTCLMKTVPKDLCTQLQLEIINLIMTAKIRHMAKPNNSNSMLIENVDDASAVDSCSYSQMAMENSKFGDNSVLSSQNNTIDILKKE